MNIADVNIFTGVSDQGIQDIGIQSGLLHFVVYREMVNACRFHEDAGRQTVLFHYRKDAVNGSVQRSLAVMENPVRFSHQFLGGQCNRH